MTSIPVTPCTETYRHNLHDCHVQMTVHPRPAETIVNVHDAALDADGNPFRITSISVGRIVGLQFHTPSDARMWLEATLLALACVVDVQVEELSLPGL